MSLQTGRNSTMGDVSIIARRRRDGTVQYGWSGNGGYFINVGQTLILWYDDPFMVDYLFGLGQVSMLREPLSEMCNGFFKTSPTGQPHWEDRTERYVFSRIAFVDYGYFYDTDNHWYYIVPEPFRIKIPLEMVSENLDERGYEFDFLNTVSRRVIDYVMYEYPKMDSEFAVLLERYDMEELRRTLDTEFPLYELFEHYREIYEYFDDWVVIVPGEDGREIAGVLMRRREDPRTETINWPGHPNLAQMDYMNPVIQACAFSYVAGWLEFCLNHDGTGEDCGDGRTVPSWFIDQFRSVMGDRGKERALFEDNYLRLCAESERFNKMYKKGCVSGREDFYDFMKRKLANA